LITFGIITDGNEIDRVHTVINSILGQLKSGDEIIVACDKDVIYYPAKNVRSTRFHGKKSWITRKKNLIAEDAKNDTIVLMHDYIKLLPGWRREWDSFGYKFDCAMNVILNQNGERYRDWAAWDNPKFGHEWTCEDVWCPGGMKFSGRPHIVPYNHNETQYMYISGAYFLVNRRFLLDNPLNENLCWGQGEDVEWCLRIRDKWNYVMNPNAQVQLLKQKDKVLPVIENANTSNR